jgi:predicted outer membrane lipoprotein
LSSVNFQLPFAVLLAGALAVALGLLSALWLERASEKTKLYAPSLLAGGLLLLCFYDYFGYIDWVFSSHYGSEQGGGICLVLFLLGGFLSSETGEAIIWRRFKKLGSVGEKRHYAALVCAVCAFCAYSFVVGIQLTTSAGAYISAVFASAFIEVLIFSLCCFCGLSVLSLSKHSLFTFVAFFALSRAVGATLAMILSEHVINEMLLTSLGAAACGALLCGAVKLISGSRQSLTFCMFGFAGMLLVKLIE